MISKNNLIFPADSDELKLIISHACDLYTKAAFSGRTFYTRFLTPADAKEIDRRFPKGDVKVSFWGGYEEAERVVGVFGEKIGSDCPIKCINVSRKGDRELSHRDYLGTVLSLGLKREMVGDIIVRDDGAYIFCLEEMADYIADNLTKIANTGVRVCVQAPDSVSIERNFKKGFATVSSLRLDCVVSALCGKSRALSAQLISRGLVSHNYHEATSASVNIKDGDVISIRGEGKYIVNTDGSLTRKGRIHIDINKFV